MTVQEKIAELKATKSQEIVNSLKGLFESLSTTIDRMCMGVNYYARREDRRERLLKEKAAR